MDYISEAFDAGFNTARNIHQAGFEIPLNILQSAGLPEDLTKTLKGKHEDVIGSIYDSVQSVIGEVGKSWGSADTSGEEHRTRRKEWQSQGRREETQGQN